VAYEWYDPTSQYFKILDNLPIDNTTVVSCGIADQQTDIIAVTANTKVYYIDRGIEQQPDGLWMILDH